MIILTRIEILDILHIVFTLMPATEMKLIPGIILFTKIILLTLAACQSSPPIVGEESGTRDLPTLFVLPSATAPPSATPTLTLSATVTASATITDTPTPVTPTPTTPPTLTPSSTPSPLPTRLPVELPARFVFGQSVQGRDLLARVFGQGDTVLMLVGGIHTGPELNTVTLVEELITHFEAHPADVLPGMALVLIPALNVDGAELGRVNRGRLNANNVDLNRNWACGWQPVAYFRSGEVDPGARPFSEPESAALAGLINDLRPAAVLFYHSAANGVFAGRCSSAGHSQQMAAVLGAATGYPYDAEFSDYPVSGTAPNWVDGLGIPAADVELATASATEFDRNLRGVLALQCWLLGERAANLPACAA
jgi:hypothetical protein